MTSRLRQWVLASPPAEFVLNQIRKLLVGALQQGPIPKHVAFVMDGNRRFARSHRIETVEGHNLGFEALARILEVCYNSGVTHVTIYAFSIENFKRSKYEVDALMDMAKIKLTQISQHGALLDRYGASIRILGQRELIQPDVLEAIDKAVQMTAHNNKAVLNVCFPYTSREEITTAIRSTVEEWTKPIESPSKPTDRRSPFKEERIAHTIRSQHLSQAETLPKYLNPTMALAHHGTLHSALSSTTSLSSTLSSVSDNDNGNDASTHPAPSSISSNTTPNPSSPDPDIRHPTTPVASPKSHHPPIYPSPELIHPSTLTAHMFTAPDPPLDLLLRTSGVNRLSDFMLWQCHETTQIVFLPVLWPDFDLWTFLPVLWEWQWRVTKEARLAELAENGRGRTESKRGEAASAVAIRGDVR